MALKTNYKDDVYSGQRKYRMTTNPDTTVSFTDETDYTQQGDTYGAAQINEQNDHINTLDNTAFKTSDSASNDLVDGDYIPFYDTSASSRKKILFSKLKELLLGAFAPKVHNSNSAGTYGAGTGSTFGHVKLSDSYTSSGGAASSSVGASSQAVYDAYRNRAPINHASTATTYGKGDASNYGHVKLSDTYTSNPGAASAGVGASGKGLYDAYTALNGSISSVSTRAAANTSAITNLQGRMNSAENTIASTANRTGTIEGELTANGNRIYMDYKNGKYGYNTSANRGADTFHPFNNRSKEYYIVFNYLGNLDGYSYTVGYSVSTEQGSDADWSYAYNSRSFNYAGVTLYSTFSNGQWHNDISVNKAGKLYDNSGHLIDTFGSGGGTCHMDVTMTFGCYGAFFEAD